MIVSSIWAMRGMPRVVTLSTWVSPRWNRAEPCAVGRRSISAESGRMSAVPRPSTRRPSSTMRLRTSFLVSERMAALISPAAPLELVGQCGLDLLARPVQRSVALGLGRDQVGLGDEVGADRLDPGPDVLGVVDLRREFHGLDRPVGGDHLRHQLALEDDGLADPRLGRLEAFGQHLFGHLGRTGLVVLPRVLGPACFHHHDGDVGVGGLAPGPDRRPPVRRWRRRPLRRSGAGSRCPRRCRPPGRRRWGRRRGCPTASAPPRRR